MGVLRWGVGFCLLSAASLKLGVLDWLCVVLLGEEAQASVSMWCLVVVRPFLAGFVLLLFVLCRFSFPPSFHGPRPLVGLLFGWE